MRAALFHHPARPRSVQTMTALREGIPRHGWTTDARDDADVAVIYGLSPSNLRAYHLYRDSGRPVVVLDLGYWSRGTAREERAFYKVSINYWHPTAYVCRVPRSQERLADLGLHTYGPRDNPAGHVLVAGMGPKGCDLYGMGHQDWDRWAVAEVRRHTDRRIVYRPKPSWPNAPTIPGTIHSPHDQALGAVLREAWCVVTHHSNVALDALVLGVPAITVDGVGAAVMPSDITLVGAPPRVPDPAGFLAAVAWCQWSVSEMRRGDMWAYVLEELRYL